MQSTLRNQKQVLLTIKDEYQRNHDLENTARLMLECIKELGIFDTLPHLCLLFQQQTFGDK